MMKKLMTLLLVFAIASVASATTVWIDPIPEGEPGSATNPLRESDTILIPVHSEGGLYGLNAILRVIEGPGSIVGAVGKVDAAAYGWDPTLSFDPDITPLEAEFGMGTFGAPAAGVVGYYIVHCDGEGAVIVGLLPGQNFGGSGDTMLGAPDFLAGDVTVYQIPEPMTVALLGLGGLALLRRRK